MGKLQMTRAEFSDETLMAFADGELDAANTEAVLEAMAEDEGLAERVALLADTRRLAKAALAPALADPVPAALESRVRAMLAQAPVEIPRVSTAVHKPAPANDNALRRWRDMAAAACVALALGIGIGWQGSGGNSGGVASPSGSPSPFAALARGDLASVLASAASGTEQNLADGARLRTIATFRANSGEVCREFELDGTDGRAVVAVACRADGAWDIRLAVASVQSGDGYAPASSLETLDAYLRQIEAGAPMSAEEERAALAASN
jgi:anti-sigma factor RsiW